MKANKPQQTEGYVNLGNVFYLLLHNIEETNNLHNVFSKLCAINWECLNILIMLVFKPQLKFV